MSAFTDLPRYRCHKVVRAAPILAIEPGPTNGEFMLALDLGDGVRKALGVPERVFARSLPDAGDYLVIYDDDYISWSTKRVFEDGYAALAE